MTKKDLQDTTSSTTIARMEQNTDDGLGCDYADDAENAFGMRRLKFGDQGRGPWRDRATGEPVPADLLLTLTAYRQGYQRFFGPGVALEIIPLAPDEKFDVQGMNAAVPKEEWRENPYTGKLEGPYQGFREVLFIDEKTATPWAFSAPITTVGGSQGIKELRRIVRLARKKDATLRPRILLRDAPMPTTKYGVVPRPYFDIQKDQWTCDATTTTDTADNDDGVGVEQTPPVDYKGDKNPY